MWSTIDLNVVMRGASLPIITGSEVPKEEHEA
jgi:hypothetical protein